MPAVHSLEVSFLLRPLVRRRLAGWSVDFVESRRLLSSSFAVASDDEALLGSLRALTPYLDR